jgi:hypothetical protein
MADVLAKRMQGRDASDFASGVGFTEERCAMPPNSKTRDLLTGARQLVCDLSELKVLLVISHKVYSYYIGCK